ncbi:hypothetical protein H5410_056661, partial [Solanum commersonii]
YLEFEAKHGHYLAKKNKKKINSVVERSSQCIAEQFREVVLYRPLLQNPHLLKANAERGRKIKTTKLIAGGIGSTMVQPEKVNSSPSPTHSTQES